jgi:hypothetical protein
MIYSRVMNALPLTPSKKRSAAESYVVLRTAIRKAIRTGKERAFEAVEREKVRTSWEIGHLILSNILLHKSRADRGAETILKLSKDLAISQSQLYFMVLYFMVEFARAYPNFPTSGNLTWNHFTPHF